MPTWRAATARTPGAATTGTRTCCAANSTWNRHSTGRTYWPRPRNTDGPLLNHDDERHDDGAVTRVWHGEHVIEDQGQPPLVLVISAWRERGGLRARITFSHPDDKTGRTSAVVGGSD